MTVCNTHGATKHRDGISVAEVPAVAVRALASSRHRPPGRHPDLGGCAARPMASFERDPRS